MQLKMRNTLISPDFPYKLLALHMFTVKDWEVNITKSQMRIFNSASSQTVFLGDKDPHTLLYFLRPASKASCEQPVTSHSFLARSYGEPKGSNIDLLWQLHQRLGHRNFADIGRQYSIPVPKQVPACVSCIMGKSHKHPYLSEGFERATRVAEGFHSDFRGPFSVHTPQGHLYLLTLIDDLSDRIFGFLAKTQTEWHEIWPKFVLRVESEIGRPNCIAWLLSDNGGVYIAEKTTTFNSSKGIRQRLSAPYAQWMNHTAERNMRTIGEMAVTTLVHSNLPKSAWGYAVLLAIEVINRTADNAERNKQSGFPAHFSRLEKWKGKELPLQTKALYPFGCLAFKHVPAVLRSKLDQHATPVVYLGVDPKSGSYLLGSLYDLDVSTSVDVTFVENVFPFRKLKHRQSPASLLWGTDHNFGEGDPRLGMFSNPDSSGVSKVLDRHALRSLGINPAETNSDASVSVVEHKQSPPPAPPQVTSSLPATPVSLPQVKSSPAVVPVAQCSLWNLQSPEPYVPSKELKPSDPAFLLAITETQLQTITPKSADQALRCQSHAQWLGAMNREKQCHVKNGTFGEEWNPQHGPCPKPVPAGWVFKIKHRGEPVEEKDLQPKQFKARVVIRGQFMQEGLDFNDTFAPVAKQMTIRAVLAVATKYGCKLKAGDIETAFLSANMDCEVWVHMPPFWGRDDGSITAASKSQSQPPRRLLKGVPGIPQASRLFYDTFAEHLKYGLDSFYCYKCLFLHPELKEHAAVSG